MDVKIRFGVRSQDGRTSNVWICWTHREKGDAYLTSDVLGKMLKLSDHPTGRSHIAYHYEKRDDLFTVETLPKQRFILKREDAKRVKDVCSSVACLFFPAGSLGDIPRAAPVDTIWLPGAPEGLATEVGIFRLNVQTLPNSWPGKREGANLVGWLPLGGVGQICIVWRFSTFQMPPTTKNTVTHGLFKGRTEEELLESNRAVIFGTTDTGAFSLIETTVSVKRNDVVGDDGAAGNLKHIADGQASGVTD